MSKTQSVMVHVEELNLVGLQQWYHRVIMYPNGYKASVICKLANGVDSYGGRDGLFEMAIMKGDEILYRHPIIPEGVIGHLDFWQVADLLKRIEALAE